MAAIFLLCTQYSCEVINPAEDVPAYLTISSFTLTDNPDVNERSLAAKIVAANVLVNNETVGVISIPGTLPVFAAGEATITLDPLVQQNGSGEMLEIYPFWERVNLAGNFSPDDTLVVNPQTRYVSGVTVYGSDFTGTDILFVQELDENSQTAVSITNQGGQAGEGTVGKITLTDDNPIFEGATTEGELIDVSGANRAFLEVQYKTDVNLLFGVLDKTAGNTETVFREYGVLAKDSWNTLYFDMSSLLISQNVGRFQLVMSATYPVGSGLDEAIILLDNIKVVYL